MSGTDTNSTRNQCGPAAPDTAARGGATIIDVEMENELRSIHARDIVPFLVFIVVFISASCLVSKLNGPMIVSLIIAVLGMGLVSWWMYVHMRHAECNVRAMTVECTTLSPETIAESVISRREYVGSVRALMGMLRGFVDAGRCGLALRLVPKKHMTSIRPLDVQFEPLPVNEAVSGFADLQAARPKEVLGSDETPVIEAANAEERDWLRRVRRYASIRGGWKYALLSLGVTMYLVGGAIYRSPSAAVVFAAVAAGSVLLGWFATRDQEFLVVPGALIHRQRRWFGGAWEVRVFSPRTSMICVCPSRGMQWLLIAADAATAEQCVLTQAEAEFVLGAWQSPLPPPTAEQLSDLQ